MAKRKHSAPADLGSETQPNAIPVEPFLPPDLAPPWRRDEVFHNLAVLITAFEEVERYDPHRQHNQPPPSLWLNHAAYRADVKDLLGELRELNKALRDLAGKDKEPPKAVAKKIEATLSVLGAGGRKFVESYADLLGKGAAALTIGAVAGFLASAGLPRELVDAVWGRLRGK
jgi:hypothetical protein